jgi:hypothetical protein
MKRSFRLVSVWLVSLLFSLACKEINPEEPDDTPYEYGHLRKASLIAAPVAVEVEDLEKMINAKLKTNLYKDDSYEGDGVKLQVSRFADIQIKLVGDVLHYVIPLKVIVSAKKAGITFGGKDGIETRANINMQSKIKLTPHWHIKSDTKFKGIDWVTKPSTKIIGIKVNLDKVVERFLEKKATEIEDKIDEVVYKKIDLRNSLKKTWLELQKPILINKKFKKVWLRAVPEKIFASQPYGKDGMLRISLKIQALVESVVGENPKVSVIENLPNLVIQNKIDEGFELHLQSKIFFDEVNAALSENLKDIKVPLEEYNVVIKSMELLGRGKKLVVKAEIDGDSKGTLTLSVQDFNFDVKTEEILMESAAWLVNNSFKDFILEKLTFKLNPHFEKIPDLVLQAMSKSKVAKKVELDFKSFVIRPEHIHVEREGIVVKVSSFGKINVEILKLN